jgi:uncharacterized protein
MKAGSDLSTTTNTDILIVGGGPAGLSAVKALSQSKAQVLLVEEGPDLEIRDDRIPTHLTNGIGGAGLFSDGKFSFYPSASRLWMVEPRAELRGAYEEIMATLAEGGLAAPAFPDRSDATAGVGSERFAPKRYLSAYMPIESRYALMRRLQQDAQDRIVRGHVALVAPAAGGEYAVDVSTDRGARRIKARAILLCGGRFGMLSSDIRLPSIHTKFRRVELGLRIQQPSETFFLRDDPYLDSKYICSIDHADASWRTFCCCRDGEIITTDFRGWRTLSGRADGISSGFSNVGFNLRYGDSDVGRETWSRIRASVEGTGRTFRFPLYSLTDESGNSATAELDRMFGEIASADLRAGLAQLARDFGANAFDDAIVHGPTVEGVGEYFSLEDDLRLGEHRIWVAGDTTGLFRGLTAALVSGYFVGKRALANLINNT